LSHQYYPVALDLKDRPCLVVGGGPLAEEKVLGLLYADAHVKVVSRDVTERIETLSESGQIELRRGVYRPDDLQGIYLAYGASEDRELIARVACDARTRAIIVNAVDDIPNCDFFAVSVVRRGDLQVAISTNGLSPAFARWMREYLDERIPREFADLLAVLGDVRRQFRVLGPVPAYEAWREAITDEALGDLRRGDVYGARERVFRALSEDNQPDVEKGGQAPRPVPTEAAGPIAQPGGQAPGPVPTPLGAALERAS
jgi:precorrin-2 dehydrogenase/sirohydrochlorin ferrochelatase